jgi:MFS family permease
MPTLESVCKRLFAKQSSMVTCLLGGVLMIIPVAHFLAFGLLYSLIDQVRRGEDPEFPSWRGWRGLLVDGVVAFVIFLILGVAPICAGWVLSWPLRSMPIGPLCFLPLMPGVFLAAPLTAAGIYQYQKRRSFGAAFRFPELAGMLQSCGGGLIVPTLAFLGFAAVGYPLLPITLFIGLAVAFPFYAMFFRTLEESRKTGTHSS